MLVLTRRAGQEIRIGDSIVIRVVCARRDQVQIGIEAPREIPILRGELCELGRGRNSAEAEESPELAGVADQA